MKKVKVGIAVLLTLVMAIGCFTSVFAAEGERLTFTSPTGEYKAEKITHPGTAAGEVDGIIDYESGDADRGQSYSWSAQGYGDWMYVGTCYGAIVSTLNIMASQMGMEKDTFKAAMNALYNGALYMGDEKNNPEDVRRSIIVKVNMKTGETKIVVPPDTMGGYRASLTFNGKLYFVSTHAAPRLIEINPKDDSYKTVYTSAKPTDPFVSTGIRGIASLDGRLYAAMIGDDGAYIVASENPTAGQESFKVVATQEDLLDYPAYMYNDAIFGGSIWDMVSFNGKLYVTVVTGKAGQEKQAFALFSGVPDKATGKLSFKLLVGDPKDGAKYPYGFGAVRSGACNLVVHDNHLYLGGYNDPMVALPAVLNMEFEELYRDLSAPVNLWRMDAEENFELVAGEPNEHFPKVSGNMGSGFGSNMNQYVWRMASYDGKLFVGTFDICGLAYPVMQFTNGDILKMSPEQWKTQIKYIREFIELIKAEGDESPVASAISSAFGGDASAASVLADAGLRDIADDSDKSLKKAVNDAVPTLDKGIDEPVGDEEFTKEFAIITKIYEAVRGFLPKELTSILDKLLTEENSDQLTYALGICKYLSKGDRGFDLLVSEDGVNFDVITRDGLGDPNNHGLRVFAVTDAGLGIGTANPFYGTQLWLLGDKVETTEPTDPTEPPKGDGGSGDKEPQKPGDGSGDKTDPTGDSVDGDIPDTSGAAAIILPIIAAALPAGAAAGGFAAYKRRKK